MISVIVASVFASLCHVDGIPDRFDKLFYEISMQLTADQRMDCREVKRRAWVESNFREDAVSPVGAGGLFQVMPATARNFGHRPSDVFDRKKAKVLVPKVMNWSWSIWISRRSYSQHRDMERMTYNAGPGPVLRWQVECRNPSGNFEDILPCIDYEETLNYVYKHREFQTSD